MSRLILILPLLIAGGAIGCGGPEEPTDSSIPTWEQFLAQSTRVVDGDEIYLVEWDIRVPTLEALEEYYERTYHPREDGVGISEDSLLVNTIFGLDDYWRDRTATHLRYCISTDFGSRQGRARAEMRIAASAWARLANVAFIDDPTQDAFCNNLNPLITFAVRPWNSGGACSFFPSGDGCVERTLVIDYTDFDTGLDWPRLAPNLTTTGVLKHEIGHILGFRHEHTSRSAGTCFEDNNFRELTEYDQGSVMHYQWCNGVTSSDMDLTDKDERGSVSLYGLSTPALATVVF